MILRLVMVLFCLSAAPMASAQTGVADPSAAEGRDAYWRAVDAQDYPAAFALLEPGNQALQSSQEYQLLLSDTIARIGPLIERRVMRTTVYENPSDAPRPGIYVAFDYVARHQHADRLCGYIILFQPPEGGPYLVGRTEQTFMENDAAAGLARDGQTPDSVWAYMASTYCPGWQPSWTITPPV